MDAFDPLTNRYDADVLGTTMLTAENHTTGFVGEQFMRGEDAKRGNERASFRSG